MAERNPKTNRTGKGTSEPDDPVQTDSPQAIENGGQTADTDRELAARVERAREIQRKERQRAGG